MLKRLKTFNRVMYVVRSFNRVFVTIILIFSVRNEAWKTIKNRMLKESAYSYQTHKNISGFVSDRRD